MAAVLSGVSGACAGLLPAAFAAVVQHRRGGDELALTALVLAGALFAALALTIVAAINIRWAPTSDGAGLDRRSVRAAAIAIPAAIPAVLCGVIELVRVGDLVAAIAAVAVIAAAVIGSFTPPVALRTARADHSDVLAAVHDTSAGRLPEPWLVLAARVAADDRKSSDVAVVIRRGVVISLVAVTGAAALGLVLARLPSAAPPWHVVLEITGILIVVPAAAVAGAGLRRLARPSYAGKVRSSPVVAGASRPHSGAVSLRRASVETAHTAAGLNVDVAPGEHVGLLVPPGPAARSLTASLLELAAPWPPEVVHYGTDGRVLGPSDVLPQVGLVTPDVTLVAGTIRDNLIFIAPPADEARIGHAVASSGLGAMLTSCGTGLDADINTLTWDPTALWQLAAARVLLAAPPVAVVYDPFPPAAGGPTLPPDAMHALGHGRTLLLITSRSELVDETEYVVRVGR